MSEIRLKRTLGVGGATFMIVGYVVGASIFILPGQLAGIAGPAVSLAYVLAAVPALLNCFIAAQVGSAFPTSGSPYVMTSVALSPLLGFLLVWLGAVGLIIGVPLVAFGFADYLAFFIPGLNRTTVAVLLVSFLTVVNLFGVKASVGVQSAMVIVFFVVLAVFGLFGLVNVDWSLMVPLFPNGYFPVMDAAVPAFYSYFGFSVIVFLAEEIKEPSRTIPLALAFSFFAVAALYLSITVSLPGLIPWTELANTDAPLGAASERILPRWFAAAMSASALLASASSINGVLLTSSRSFLALGRDQIFPAIFARLNPRTGEPDYAILLVAVLSVLGVFIGAGLVQYASVAVVIYMLFGLVWALALLRLPSHFPEHYRRTSFQLGTRALWVLVWLKVATSLVFGFVGVRDNLEMCLGFLGMILLGVIYYFVRRELLRRRGIQFEALLRKGADDLLNAEH